MRSRLTSVLHPSLELSAPARDTNRHTYLGEARQAREAFERWPEFQKMPYNEARLVAGFGPNAGWFGSMKGNGVWMNLVGNRRDDLARIIDPIPPRGEVPDNLVLQAFRIAETLPRVKIGCTSRLLCMKRPDLFFTVNAGNKRRMREILGICPRQAGEYVESLRRLRNYPWYSADEPADYYERELWQSRVGLLDAVLYEPE